MEFTKGLGWLDLGSGAGMEEGWVVSQYRFHAEGVCVCVCVCSKSLQLCLTLWNPVDCSLPDSSVHGILQARVLEQVAISYSRGASRPRD